MIDIDKEKILKLEEEKQTFVVQFSASWCGPCRTLSPMLEKICNEEKVSVYKLDVSKNQDYAKELKIYSIPFVKFYKDGEEFHSASGLRGRDFYEQKVKSLTS